jgi:hypothetical protein
MSDGLNAALGELRSQEPAQPTPDEARRWLEIYQQLIDMTEVMLAQTRSYLAGLQPPARRYVSSVNVRLMEDELESFRARHALWAEHVGSVDTS